jgi:hypothetical protein
MSQPPNQPYPGQPHPEQPGPEDPWPGQPYPGPSYPGQSYPAQPGYPGQPYQGQPNPDVPSSVPPQPGYPPAGPPMQGYPPAPRKKSKALPITLVSIALVLVVCVGGSTAIYLAGRNTVEGLTDAISSGAPTPRATSRTEPTEDATIAPTITIAEPKKLSGRPKVTDPTFAATADQLKKSLALLPGATQTVGAVYGTPSKQDLVLVVAAKSFVADPKTELDNAFSGSNVDSLKLTGITSIPAGPLGGVAKCAKGKGGGSPLSMCAWADEGSSGWVIWYFTSLSKAKAEFIKVRGQVEKKSN